MIFRIATMCVAAFVLFTAGIRPSLSATDLNTVIQFNIPPGPLPGALLKYSSQSGIQVTSASDLVDRKQSAGVKGSLPAGQALSQLLLGTQLEFDAVNPSTVSIRREAASASGALPPSNGGAPSVPATVSQGGLEEIVVTARRREERAQSVPASITAYSARDVKTHNITDQLSLANNTPSLIA